MIGESFIKSCLSHHAWQIGHKHGFNGMLAILFIFRNRMQSGWHHSDWLKIIEEGRDCLANDYPDTREPEFQRLLQWVDGVYDGTIEDKITNGALAYMDEDGYLCPDIPKMKLCATVGTLQLFK